MKLHIFGASGSGTSTLGQMIAEHYGWALFDIDNFYWQKTDPPFTVKNDVDRRHALLSEAIASHDHWIMSGSMDSWAEPYINVWDAAIFVSAPTDTRIERLKKREYERYGDRVSVGGDLYLSSKEFIDWAAAYGSGEESGRSLPRHRQFIDRLPCPVFEIANHNISVEVFLNTALKHIESL